MSVTRSWTLIDEETTIEVSAATTVYLDQLMIEWSQISTEIEHEGFRRQDAFENGYDDSQPEFDMEDEYEEYQQRTLAREQRRQVKLDIIEGLLAAHGTRVMRPYEHWNEDERYMEYAERDRY